MPINLQLMKWTKRQTTIAHSKVMDRLNSHICIKDVESVVKIIPTMQANSIFNQFSKASFTIILKPDRDIIRKGNQSSIFLMDANNP